MIEAATPAASALEEQDVFTRIKQWYSESSQQSGNWRDETRESYAFVAGDQYDEKDRARLKELMRPCLSFNRIGPVIDSVSGMEVNNRQEVRYIPRTEGDAKANEMLTGGAAWVRDECDAEDEESDAFIDLLIGGMGWTETRIEYETEPDGMIRIERVDPFEMYWDPSARRRNLDDARYVIRVREMDISDAKAMFPDVDEEHLNAPWSSAANMDGKAIDREASRDYDSDGSRQIPRRGRVRIAECQWWELEPFWRAIDPATGGITELSEADYRKLSKKVTLESVRQQRRVYKRAFLGTKVLEGGPAPCDGHFTYRCMTGKRDRNKGDWYGLVRPMKDPQKFANKLMSSVLHIMSTSGKGIMVELGAIDDIAELEADWAHPDKIVKFTDGALARGAVQPKPGGVLPAGMADMMMQSISAIRDVSGVNLEMLGLADRQQAGVLEAQRKQSAMTVLATLFDSLRRYRKEQGRVLLHFILKYLNDGRLMRITQDEAEGFQPFKIDDENVKYDVIVDQSATSPNQKEATWVILGQLMPTLMKLPIPPEMWAEIIKNSPLPESFSAKMKQIMEQQAQQPPQPSPEEMKIQADQQMKQQQLAFEKEKAGMDGQLEQGKAMAQLEMKKQEMQANIEMKRMEMEAEIQLEREKAALQFQLDQQKMDNQLKLESYKATQQVEIDKVLMQGKANNEGKVVDAKLEREKRAETEKHKPQTDAMAGLSKATLDGLREIAAAMSKPKKIKRGADGRAEGLE